MFTRCQFTHCAMLTFLCGFVTYESTSAQAAGIGKSTSQPITIEVDAGPKQRGKSIFSFELPKKWRGMRHFQLVRSDSKTTVPVQVYSGAKPRVFWIDTFASKANGTRRYQFRPLAKRIENKNAVTCIQDDKGLVVRANSKPVLRYNTAILACPGKGNAAYNRSGFIHPLYDPAGRCVTDDFPPDHLHQHGIMFPWVDTTFEKRHVDFWNQGKKLGTVEHVKVLIKVNGPVFAEFVVQLQHVDLKAKKTALNETWTVRVYNIVDYFVFDVESVQVCAGKSPLQINKYHYGGMAIRGTRHWFKKGACDFLTSERKTRKNGNHTRPRWVDIFGAIDGKKSGVAIFCHPKNFRFPQPVRMHPSKPYFCWAPEFLGRFSIVPGISYESRYRFVVHTGAPDGELLDRIWNDYADPLTVRMVK